MPSAGHPASRLHLALAAPGGLTELGAAVDAWHDAVAKATAAAGFPRSPSIVAADESNATELRMPDWPAVPARVRGCLGRDRADRLLDARVDELGDVGRLALQEEYAEWRIVRGTHGPTRFELSTELPEYWELLAQHVPEAAIKLVGDFARRPVALTDLFGDATQDGEARLAAFRAQMLGRDPDGHQIGRPGPLNNGIEAITCLSYRHNNLAALLELVAAAAKPLLVTDSDSGEDRFASGSEAIRTFDRGAAQDCRNSDPVIVERIVRLATEGRAIRLDDPVGVYIVDFQHAELLTPDGEPLPSGWFELSRGKRLADGLARHQRLVLDIPTDAGFDLSDVLSRRTGRPIAHGAEIAELVQLAIYLRVSARGVVPVDITAGPVPSEPADGSECAGVHLAVQQIEQAQP